MYQKLCSDQKFIRLITFDPGLVTIPNPLNLLMKVSWWPIDFTFAAGTIWNFKFNLVPI